MSFIYFTDNVCTSYKLEIKRFHDYFVANGWSIVTDPAQADLIFVGTCVAFENLERESLERLREVNQLGKQVVAYGCLTTFNPTGLAMVHDGIRIATTEAERVGSLLAEPTIRLEDIPEPSTFRSKEDYRLYDLTKRFVNTSLGCAFVCSFCPHKLGIGNLRSRPPDDIVKQIHNLVSEGVRIVVLTGSDTGAYGIDLNTTFLTLLREVLDIHAGFEIHVAQFNPAWVLKYRDGLLPLFSNPRVTDIQIPIQTTSPRLLRLMRRPCDTDRIDAFLQLVRRENEKAIFRTDLLVGFPTETEQELMETLEFATRVFDEIAVYAFERKTGVPLENMGLEFYTADEVHARAELAIQYIANVPGRLVHQGGQGPETLVALEKRKEELRQTRYLGCKPSCPLASE
jgi:tRNA A37 methylthiotransferase MiaB